MLTPLKLTLLTVTFGVSSLSHAMPVQHLAIAGHALTVEVARTQQEQRLGLMHRAHLDADRGMLFVFTPPRKVSMWMKNTLIDLDAAFIDACGRIERIARMQRQSETLHSSVGSVSYVLETNVGWFKRHDIRPGDTIDALIDTKRCRRPR